jgi:hypothetical protein
MKTLSCGLVLLSTLISGAVAQCQGQAEEKRVSEIRQLYQQVTQQIEESEKHGEESSIYLNEVAVNKNRGSWPAVGIYEDSLKFYYTFGDREKNPYPNRLLKIVVTTRRSSQTSYVEFLFNPLGQLVFCFQKDEEGERRYYFSNERLIRSTVGPNNELSKGKQLEPVRALLTQKRKLVSIFVNSLEN